jgi:hypothetical protein
MINKSRLFKMAWKGFKTQQRNGRANASFGKSLKWAWSILKQEASCVAVNIARETAKAIAITARVVCEHTDQVRNRLIWIPKSLMQPAGVPEWFLNKKCDELRSSFNYPAYLDIYID